MKLYGAIDLHSNNSVIAILDEKDGIVYQKRLPNDLGRILHELSPHREQIQGVAVESTYNWYWLVDGLVDAGYALHLVNTNKVQQYEGLKYTDDESDARHLAHLLRLGILPEGYIYPKESRAVRDLLRKRSQLVRQRTMQILSLQNQIVRRTAHAVKGELIKRWTPKDVDHWLCDPSEALAAKSNLAVLKCLEEQIQQLEAVVRERSQWKEQGRKLKTVDGIGDILGLTILLETGDIHRFSEVGHYVSYCRCVSSKKMSNGKKKGKGNARNGNKYLSWAYVEAAQYAIRTNERIRRFHQRKANQRNKIVAIKAVAHKLARACYHVLKNNVPFEVNRAFV